MGMVARRALVGMAAAMVMPGGAGAQLPAQPPAVVAPAPVDRTSVV